MIRKILVALALAASLGLPGSAVAQGVEFGPDGVRIIPPGYHDDDRGISERQAVRIARRNGVEEVTDVDRNRRSFEVSGFDRRDRHIRIVVARRDGAILDVDRWR
jgi:hypothetical protein